MKAVSSSSATTGCRPGTEHEVDPLDPELGLAWPAGLTPIPSGKDRDAPSIAQARTAGLLPTWDACRARYAELPA